MQNNEGIQADQVQALKDYLVNSDGLIRILEKETEYYKSMKMNQAEKLVESKQSIVDKIEGYKEKLTSEVSFLKRLPSDIKTKLKDTTAALGKAADANYREAVKAKEVNKVILESVSKALMKHQSEQEAYSNEGESAYVKNGTPVAINEII